MRVLTFSRFFPAYHPRAGQPTYFVEKIWKGLYDLDMLCGLPEIEEAYNVAVPCTYTEEENVHAHQPKYHTIRAGKRWKVGDKFSPRVWSGRPYNSKQIIIGPDIEIRKVWHIMFYENGIINVSDRLFSEHKILAKNDGLSFEDFNAWFPAGKRFEGQIICWNETIEYVPATGKPENI